MPSPFAAHHAPLDGADTFLPRHIGPDEHEQAAMLARLGHRDLEAFTDAVVPAAIRLPAARAPRAGLSETAALAALRERAVQNTAHRSLIGQGYYSTLTPAPILRNLLENPAWYTAYTPYQPEISQGRLEALFNFQTMVADLTALPVANASLLDEASAAAEAMTFCRRIAPNKTAQTFFVSDQVFPQTLAVLRTRAAPLGIVLEVGDAAAVRDAGAYFGLLLQYPADDGSICDPRATIARFRTAGARVAMAADLLALTLLLPPGELGADVAIGSVQRFGVPLGYGGPHAAYFATRDEHKRDMPGRLVGLSLDRLGQPALRLAMQTREQHIRRERATSNICTAQVLLANMASMYAVYHGPEGIRAIAARIHQLTALLAAGWAELGFQPRQQAFFDTFTLHSGRHTSTLHAAAQAAGFNLRVIDAQHLGLSLDEASTPEEVQHLFNLFATVLQKKAPHFEKVMAGTHIPHELSRTSAYLTHPVFHQYRSETSLMRYLRQLADKDLALDRTMIPLGSCTMKLNAASEMLPITWPEFSAPHPFAPNEQVRGYQQMIAELEAMLCEITGYDAASLQPNAGSQGEYAGLLAIRAWHASRGEQARDICLIPASAHGTNPATATMAGLRVVVVACDREGNVDLADLRDKTQQHSTQIAALMMTYPSTHGVFEEAIGEICQMIHAHGGQVYIDGANLNAMVGLCAPGRLGGDVSHLNLHKTFCIPHGGGGPGVGPVVVKQHLAPFLPERRQMEKPSLRMGAQRGLHNGAVSAAPYGSASILPISWMYLNLMGGNGLRQASQVAMLNANYLAHCLHEHYPVLYSGRNGLVAHECILDLRPLKETSGITVDDVAKRLIDYGFHAPTMSFPVPGTLMIEPTESESKTELDRFIAAMIAIRAEIRAVEDGRFDREDNPLKNAPHTARELAGAWTHPYTREVAAYPLASLVPNKYWPPVARVDNVHGDRNLVCTCPPLSAHSAASAPQS